MTVVFSRALRAGCALSLLAMALCEPARAADLSWKGFDWKVTKGGMAGEADGSPDNVSVDANGYLHLHITKNGDTWTASELFTTQKLGFGTYQWHIEGPVDTFDKNNVLGLFPYGPGVGIGTDGTNEIDIEFARWGQANGVNADFADYPNSGTTKGVHGFKFSLGGSTSSTARFVWNSTSIESSVLKGHQALSSETDLLEKWKYAPANASVNIPQRAMPLGMNLWCFGAPPSDGKNVEIVIRDFQFIAEGKPLPGTGGSGGSSGNAGNGGSAMGGSATGGGTATTGGANSAGAAGAGSGGTDIANGGSAGNQQPASGGEAPTSAGAANGGVTTGNGGSASTPLTGAGASTATGGTDNSPANESAADAGCACQLAGGAHSQAGWALLIGLTALGLRRRRFLNHLDAR